jgi:hypothetical protein
MQKSKCGKMWATIVIVIAVLFGLLVLVLPQDRLSDIVYVPRFFDIVLPILAFGALIKYLCCCGKSGCDECCSSGKCSGNCDCSKK